MMGPRQEAQAALFYEFSLEDCPHNRTAPARGLWRPDQP